MQTVVVPHDVSSFQVICDECLSVAGKDGAIARLVSGTIEEGTRQGVASCSAGHRVEALQVEQGMSAASLIGHAA
ncbi:MAG: hypothetical protein QOE29_1414 [Gaiellaceae bacterium]|jgi:hypothetical protein|nr:hypothetical protein [Gaiellaceae bacterium]